MPDRINGPPTLQADRAQSMRPCFAFNTFIIQHTVTALLISPPLHFPLPPSLISPSLTGIFLAPPLLQALCPSNSHTSHRLTPFLISLLLLPFSFTSPTLPFLLFAPTLPPLRIILFPGARDGISSSYASAPTRNMLAHDNIVSPLWKLQRVRAGERQYHSPANRDRQPSTT